MKITSLGARIRLIREELTLSQVDLSKVLKISNTTLSQYENNQRVPSDGIKTKIADYFDVSIDWLLGRTSIRKSSIVFKEARINFKSDFQINYKKEDLEILKIIKKDKNLLFLFRSLKSAPTTKVKQLIKMWNVLNQDT